jgi:hypothetical protein
MKEITDEKTGIKYIKQKHNQDQGCKGCAFAPDHMEYMCDEYSTKCTPYKTDYNFKELDSNNGIIEYKINIPDPEKLNIKLYSPKNEFLGVINTTIQLYDVRCQIKENYRINGFYIIYNSGVKCNIDKYGRFHRESKEINVFEKYLDRLMC